jgi:anthranilate synthase component 2
MMLGVEVQVHRNDALNIDQIQALAPTQIVISPGPCTPDQAGISLAVIKSFAGKIPLLGVCLGHQAIAQVFGAKVVRAPHVMHGKTSAIFHQQLGVFSGLPSPFLATRYHSLIVDEHTLPDCLHVTAWTHNQEGQREYIMGLSHRDVVLDSVQFHPEAILTEHGHALLNNFLQRSIR